MDRQLAMSGMGEWLGDSFREWSEALWSLALLGLVCWGLYALSIVVNFCLGIVPFIGPIVSTIISFIVGGVVAAILLNGCFTKLGGAEPSIGDATELSTETFFFVIVGYALVSLFITLCGGLAAIPGGLLAAIGVGMESPALVVLGVVVSLLLSLPASLFATTLTFFVLPDMVHRRTGVIDAFRRSFSAAKDDLMGLTLYVLLYSVVNFALVLASCLFLTFGFILALPLMYMLKARAYTAYFGMEALSLEGGGYGYGSYGGGPPMTPAPHGLDFDPSAQDVYDRPGQYTPPPVTEDPSASDLPVGQPLWAPPLPGRSSGSSSQVPPPAPPPPPPPPPPADDFPPPPPPPDQDDKR